MARFAPGSCEEAGVEGTKAVWRGWEGASEAGWRFERQLQLSDCLSPQPGSSSDWSKCAEHSPGVGLRLSKSAVSNCSAWRARARS